MEVIQIILILVLLGFVLSSLFKYYGRRSESRAAFSRMLKKNKPVRTLNADERKAIERAFKRSKLKNNNVYRIKGPLSRHGLQSNGRTDWHILINGVEIRPFPHWLLLQADHNEVEVARPKRGKVAIPVVFNGIKLKDALEDDFLEKMQLDVSLAGDSEDTGDKNTAHTANTDEAPDVVHRRKEEASELCLRKTLAEHNSGRAFMLCASLLAMLFASQLSYPWQLLGVPCLLLAAWNAWRLLRYWKAPPCKSPGHIRTLRGTLSAHVKETGTRTDPGLSTEIYMGDTQLKYPDHWWRFIKNHPEGTHDVSIDDEGNVVRHDALSLYEELRRWPMVCWGKYLILASCGLILVIASTIILNEYGSNSIRIAMLSNRIDHQIVRYEPADIGAFVDADPQPGDWLDIKGHAQCLSAPDRAPDFILDTVANKRDMHCPMIGWVTHATTLVDSSHDADTSKLLALLKILNPSRKLTLSLDTVMVPGLNKYVTAIDKFCRQNEANCGSLKRRMSEIATQSTDWDDTVARARTGKLPARARLNRLEAKDLFRSLQSALRDHVTSQFNRDLQKTLDAHPAQVMLRKTDAPFRMAYHAPSSLYDHNPFARRRNHRNNAMDINNRLLFSPFDLSGEIVSVKNRDDGRAVYLVHPSTKPISNFTLLVPSIVFVLAWLILLGGGIGLFITLKQRKQRILGVNSYVPGKLDS